MEEESEDPGHSSVPSAASSSTKSLKTTARTKVVRGSVSGSSSISPATLEAEDARAFRCCDATVSIAVPYVVKQKDLPPHGVGVSLTMLVDFDQSSLVVVDRFDARVRIPALRPNMLVAVYLKSTPGAQTGPPVDFRPAVNLGSDGNWELFSVKERQRRALPEEGMALRVDDGESSKVAKKPRLRKEGTDARAEAREQGESGDNEFATKDSAEIGGGPAKKKPRTKKPPMVWVATLEAKRLCLFTAEQLWAASATNGVEQGLFPCIEVTEEDSWRIRPVLGTIDIARLEPSPLMHTLSRVAGGRTLESRQLKFGTQMGSNGLLYMDIPEEEEEEEFIDSEEDEDEEVEEEVASSTGEDMNVTTSRVESEDMDTTDLDPDYEPRNSTQSTESRKGMKTTRCKRKAKALEGTVAERQGQKEFFLRVVGARISDAPPKLWTAATHTHFPSRFKAAVRTFMLCRLRQFQTGDRWRPALGSMPQLMVLHVLSFLGPGEELLCLPPKKYRGSRPQRLHLALEASTSGLGAVLLTASEWEWRQGRGRMPGRSSNGGAESNFKDPCFAELLRAISVSRGSFDLRGRFNNPDRQNLSLIPSHPRDHNLLYRSAFGTSKAVADALLTGLSRCGEARAPVNDATLEPLNVTPRLYNYQQSALRWMVSMELGKSNISGLQSFDPRYCQYQFPRNSFSFSPPPPSSSSSSSSSEPFDGPQLGASIVFEDITTGCFSESRPEEWTLPKGGFLCDQTGLGKTVVLLALIEQHARSDAEGRTEVPEEFRAYAGLVDPNEVADRPELATAAAIAAAGAFTDGPSMATARRSRRLCAESGDCSLGTSWEEESSCLPAVEDLKPVKSKATLVVLPPVLCHQWQQEIRKHTPHLSMIFYEGLGKSGYWAADFADASIVITTYQICSKDLRLHGKRKHSPLLHTEWWRVVLDEAQLMQSGMSNAARMVCGLARIYSWCLTGTPFSTSNPGKDLIGSLSFVQAGPPSRCLRVASRLVTTEISPTTDNGALRSLRARGFASLRTLLRNVMWRSNAEEVAEEIELPRIDVFDELVAPSKFEKAVYDYQMLCIRNKFVDGNRHARNGRWASVQLHNSLLSVRQASCHLWFASDLPPPDINVRNLIVLGAQTCETEASASGACEAGLLHTGEGGSETAARTAGAGVSSFAGDPKTIWLATRKGAAQAVRSARVSLARALVQVAEIRACGPERRYFDSLNVADEALQLLRAVRDGDAEKEQEELPKGVHHRMEIIERDALKVLEFVFFHNSTLFIGWADASSLSQHSLSSSSSIPFLSQKFSANHWRDTPTRQARLRDLEATISARATYPALEGMHDASTSAEAGPSDPTAARPRPALEPRDFPEKVVENATKVSARAARHYEAMVSQLGVLDAIEKPEASEPATPASFGAKLDALVKHVKSLDRNEKVVVFSSWKDSLLLAADALGRSGVSAGLLLRPGSDAMQAMVQRWSTVGDGGGGGGSDEAHTEEIQVLLILSKANSGAAGLNLVAARYLVLLEPLLDLGLEQQCKARIHRLGQTRDVHVLRLILAGSVEEMLVVPAKAAVAGAAGNTFTTVNGTTGVAARRDAALQTIGALATGGSAARNDAISKLLGIDSANGSTEATSASAANNGLLEEKEQHKRGAQGTARFG